MSRDNKLSVFSCIFTQELCASKVSSGNTCDIESRLDVYKIQIRVAKVMISTA